MHDKQQVVISGKLMFDLWRNGYWIGMAEGETVEKAKQMVIDSGLRDPEKIVMLPYYGSGTTVDPSVELVLTKPKTSFDGWVIARKGSAAV